MLKSRMLRSGELLISQHKAWQLDEPFERYIKCPGSGKRIKKENSSETYIDG